MTGQLNKHPLAEIIREISAEGLSGALRLSRERAKAVIYFGAGEIIYAASNLRAYRLPECLRRWGALTEKQLARAEGKTSDLEFGAALIKSGELSREHLDGFVTHQVSEMLCHVLLWTEGEWEFDPRVRLTEEAQFKIKAQELLMESARRLPVEFVAKRFMRQDEKISPEMSVPDRVNLLPSEAFVLTRVDAPLSLHELLAIAGLPEAETLQLVYTLALGGLLRRENWPVVFMSEEISRARAVKASEPKVAPVETTVEEKSAPEIKAPPAPVEERDEKEELADLFARLEMATNYYQVLGAVRPVKDADIKRAYHALAKRFHPDRFRKTVDSELHARIESAFARIAQAYETLKNRTSRATYDSTLLRQDETARAVKATQEPSQSWASSAQEPNRSNTAYQNRDAAQSNSGPVAYQAEEKFKRGLAALQSGNNSAAIACFGEAARLVPTQPRYRAQYGQALANDERTRRNAEAEIKAAIALDAKNPSYRVMLAELYNEIGLPRRAQAELAHALSIDPQNKVARRLFEKLKGRN